ncbi:hypothetical protein SZN_26039 [Streptomyces zinciresistens K42]|uniref:Uncharacterized protein n=1 Tax=Streptomyces zinciresistens K42 TaxID=700597 RepID=G2GI68_9ACTN|nr:DUF6529 family protein [Streptomyces zinciresistens]EGX56800.1 hypothetical protein SZN_26039 [Streptomyces zinciresistens K42]
MTSKSPHRARGHRSPARVAVIGLVVAVPVAVAAAIWLTGRHQSPQYGTGLFGAQGAAAVTLKARLGTALFALALVQLLLGVWMYGRLPGLTPGRRRVRASHRAVGWLAFLLSVPIAYHCVRTYGVETASTRVLLHSAAGCVLYGAFVAKVLVVRSRRLPGWMLPATGSVLFGAIGVLWYSAALWALNGFTVPGL